MSNCPFPFIEYIQTTELCASFTSSISLSRCDFDPLLHIGAYAKLMTVHAVSKKESGQLTDKKKSCDATLFLGTAVLLILLHKLYMFHNQQEFLYCISSCRTVTSMRAPQSDPG